MCSRGCTVWMWRPSVSRDYGKPGNYYARQIGRWSQQYLRREDRRDCVDGSVDGMAARRTFPPGDESGDRARRLSRRESDLPSHRAAHRRDRRLGVVDARASAGRSGLQLLDVSPACRKHWAAPKPSIRDRSGMPDEASYVAAYCRRTGRDGVPDWNFYLAFSMFRLASILQGVYARGLQGNAASTYALQRGAAARLIADKAWEISQRAN